MIAPCFKSRCCSEKLPFVSPVRSYYIRNDRSALSYRTRLVKHDYIRSACFLKRLSGLEKDTVFCADSVSYHYRNGSCKSQRTRTGNDQNAYPSCKRSSEGRACNKPDSSDNHSKYYHRRHENERYPVRKPCNGSFCCRRVAHHCDYFR